MTYMLDITTVLALLSQDCKGLRARVQASAGELVMSALTAAQLECIVADAGVNAECRTIVDRLTSLVQVVSWPTEAVSIYARLLGLRATGVPAGIATQVAAHAVAIGATLITRIEHDAVALGLTVEDWAAG